MRRVLPRTVTLSSCMASSNADCVFGGVRLISSASSTCANSGPGTKVQVRLPVAWSSSRMSVPVMSVGIRSGVNWMRLNDSPSALASVRTSSVLAVPGRPVIEAVTAHQQRDEQLLHHFVLAHDELAHLAADGGEGGAEAADQFAGVGVLYRSLFPVSSHFQQQFLGRPIVRRGIE